MKVFGFCQAYNEGLFMHQALQWATKVVDQLIITEGRLTPFGNMPVHSSDDTRSTIENFKKLYDKQNKIQFYDAFVVNPPPTNREGYEGVNKNFMLKKSGAENGDLIFILDVDEFWHEENFNNVVEKFRRDDKLDHVPVEEYQFAYNLRHCFNAEHNGRFFRYIDGARFGSTNHFIYPGGRDVTRNYKHLVPREDSRMAHLCWCKHPKLIKQKVESFNRPSFTMWYNMVYLGYPIHGDKVYELNQKIAPYRGRGFAEGQHEKLYEFEGKLPWSIQNMDFDWADYIRRHHDELLVR